MLRVLSCVADDHDIRLILLAAAICISGSFISIRLFSRAHANHGVSRYGWLFMTGVATGAAIWTTHFVAMLAFQPSLPASYAPDMTILSLFIAIAAVTAGFALAVQAPMRWGGIAGGAMIGIGIGAMHYTGMGAYLTTGTIEWDMTFVGVSISVGVVFSGLAIRQAVGPRWRYRKYLATGLLVLAICGLHFTGMSAVTIVPDATITLPPRAISTGMLVFAIVGVALLVLGTGFSSYLIDRRLRIEAASHIQHLAYHDTLTGLPNRLSFNEQLSRDLARCKTTSTQLAVLSLDLDGFKEVNDVFGHGAGDGALTEAAKRLRACLRDGEFLARLGGDEFVALQIATDQPSAATDLSERLLGAFRERFAIGGEMVSLSSSVGIAIYPTDGQDREEILSNSDIALYRAKSSGPGHACFFERAMDASIRKRRALAQDLKNAIARNEFELHYQVQKSIEAGTICGFEALLRWNHQTRGLVMPAEFIPLAEQTGLIVPLGDWVLQTACREAASWEKPYKVAVNLSPIQFSNIDLPKRVSEILLDTGLAPTRLELEITESTLIDNPERTLHILRSLKALGVTIAMDDFGTGYSSLSTLQSFPFDKLKLDRSFLWKVRSDEPSAAIVRAVVGLGRSLSISVLAEGVETEEHLTFLRREGCNEVQGFLMGRPVPSAQVKALIAGIVTGSAERELKRAS